MDKTPRDPTDSIEQLRVEPRVLAALFEQHRDRHRRMVALRLDPRLRARLDASDVVQEAFLDVDYDLDAYLADPELLPLLWLRPHVGGRLTTLHRHHLGTKMRDAGAGELALPGRRSPGQLDLAGRDDPGSTHLADPGCRARRADDEGPGGVEESRNY